MLCGGQARRATCDVCQRGRRPTRHTRPGPEPHGVAPTARTFLATWNTMPSDENRFFFFLFFQALLLLLLGTWRGDVWHFVTDCLKPLLGGDKLDLYRFHFSMLHVQIHFIFQIHVHLTDFWFVLRVQQHCPTCGKTETTLDFLWNAQVELKFGESPHNGRTARPTVRPRHRPVGLAGGRLTGAVR